MSDDFEDTDPTIILDNLIRYADHNKNFKRDFIDDCYDFREKYGHLTKKQLDILESIFHKPEIQEFLYEKEYTQIKSYR